MVICLSSIGLSVILIALCYVIPHNKGKTIRQYRAYFNKVMEDNTLSHQIKVGIDNRAKLYYIQ